jgi:hypothetical protein
MRPAALFESSLLLQAVTEACQVSGIASACAVSTTNAFLAAISYQLAMLMRTCTVLYVQEGRSAGSPLPCSMDVLPPDNHRLLLWLVLAWQLCEAVIGWPDKFQAKVLLDHETLSSFVTGAALAVCSADSSEGRAIAFRCAA